MFSEAPYEQWTEDYLISEATATLDPRYCRKTSTVAHDYVSQPCALNIVVASGWW
jgi:hypothetical protein